VEKTQKKISDPEAPENLAYFLRHGPKPGDGADYLVVVQGDDDARQDSGWFDETGEEDESEKAAAAAAAERGERRPPRFPAAVERALSFATFSSPSLRISVLAHDNTCYDWGTFGWALKQPEANARPYRFWVLVNSSVRGPFVHPTTKSAAEAAAAAAAAASAAASGSASSSSSFSASSPTAVPWHALLTSRLRGSVHAAGPVISCEPSPWRGRAGSGPWRANPHVQSWALALDAEALGVLRSASPRAKREANGKGKNESESEAKGGGGGATTTTAAAASSNSSSSSSSSSSSASSALGDGGPLECAADRWDAIWSGEMGSSRALLEAGMNLDCLLPRYQGVDWRLRHEGAPRSSPAEGTSGDDLSSSPSSSPPSNDLSDDGDPLHDPWRCNQRFSPTRDGSLDGLTLMPFDTMFVKFKRALLEVRAEATVAAAKLGEWEDQRWWREREREREEGEAGEKRGGVASSSSVSPPSSLIKPSSASSSSSLSSPSPLSRYRSTGVDIVSNAFVNDPAKHKVPRHGALKSRGLACFDAEAYLAASADLGRALPPPGRDGGAAAWRHALEHGQFELRPMRFRCSASEVPAGIREGAEGLQREESAFALGERARRAVAGRAAAVAARAGGGGERGSGGGFASSSERRGENEEEEKGRRGSSGLLWAYSDGRRAPSSSEEGGEAAGAGASGSGGGGAAHWRLRRRELKAKRALGTNSTRQSFVGPVPSF